MLIRFLLPAAAVLLAAAAAPKAPLLDRVKTLCTHYVEGYVSPATDLVYGKRINGPRGIAVLESPAEIAAGRVNGVQRPWGYGAGIEDLAYQNGLFLYALCDAEEATGERQFADLARQAMRGMRRIGTLSRVEGFVPRGPHPDGKSYYKNSSLDQHSLYACGLWRYSKSRLATAEDRAWIRDIVGKIMRRIEKNNWSIQAEDPAVAAWAGGTMLPMRPTESALLLSMLAVAHDITGDPHWKEAYERFGAEENGKRWEALNRKIDPSRESRYTMFINQDMTRTETLRRIETSADRKAILQQRIERTAEDMLTCGYFKAWRRLDWIGEFEWSDVKAVEVANNYLKPLGLTVDSNVTVLDLMRKFDAKREPVETISGHSNRYEPLALATPAMVWQIALLSRKPELVRQVKPYVEEMLEKVEYSRVNMGWAYNYSVLAGLWSVAAR